MNNSAKRKAEDILARPSKINHSAINENTSCLERLTNKDINLIRRNIYNARRKEMAALPKNRNEAIIKFLEKPLKTMKGKDFCISS